MQFKIAQIADGVQTTFKVSGGALVSASSVDAPDATFVEVVPGTVESRIEGVAAALAKGTVVAFTVDSSFEGKEAAGGYAGDVVLTIDDTTVFETFQTPDTSLYPVVRLTAEQNAVLDKGGTLTLIVTCDPQTHPQANDFSEGLNLVFVKVAAKHGRVICRNSRYPRVTVLLAAHDYELESYDGNYGSGSGVYKLRFLSNYLGVVELLSIGMVHYISARNGGTEGPQVFEPFVQLAFHVQSPQPGTIVHRWVLPNASAMLSNPPSFQCLSAGSSSFVLRLDRLGEGGGSLTLTYSNGSEFPTVTKSEQWLAVEAQSAVQGGFVSNTYAGATVTLVSGTPSFLAGGFMVYRERRGTLFTPDNPLPGSGE